MEDNQKTDEEQILANSELDSRRTSASSQPATKKD